MDGKLEVISFALYLNPWTVTGVLQRAQQHGGGRKLAARVYDDDALDDENE